MLSGIVKIPWSQIRYNDTCSKDCNQKYGKTNEEGKNETERAKKDYKRILILLTKPWGFLETL